jgi:hypothetical protein
MISHAEGIKNSTQDPSKIIGQHTKDEMEEQPNKERR